MLFLLTQDIQWFGSQFKDDDFFQDNNLLNGLENLRFQAGRILDQQLFSHYTDHKLSHSDRVLNNIKDIVASNLAKDNDNLRLNCIEVVVLIASAYLHDVGMQTPIFEQRKVERSVMDPELCEKVRKSHAATSSILVEKSVSRERGDYPTLGLDQNTILTELAEPIKFLCEHHSGDERALEKRHYFAKYIIRTGLLLAILRLADGLDLDQTRVNLEQLKRFSIPIDSQLHWWRHHYVQGVTIRNGWITIHMAFPEDMSPIYQDYFVTLVKREVERELGPSRRLLFENDIHVQLDDNIEVSFVSSSYKRSLPSKLEDFILDDIRKKSDTFDNVRKRLEFFKPIHKDPSDWISFWNFKGNPWTDLPLYYNDEEFVLTSSIKGILSEMASLRMGSRGELKLLVGERGSGKTTFFNSANYYAEEQGLRIRYIDVQDVIPDLKNPTQLFNSIMNAIFDSLKMGDDVKFDLKALRMLIMQYNLQKVVIGIDNLDLYSEDDHLPIIKTFFQQSQSILQMMKSKFILVFSCSPKWREMLSSKDLSYLGLKNAWELSPLSIEEIKELISRRLKISSMKFEDVFSDDVLQQLTIVTEGNPRFIVQTAQRWCELAAQNKVKKIDRKFIERYDMQDILEQSRALIQTIARRSTYLADALSSLYIFSRDMDRRNIQSDRGWEYFLRLCEGDVNVSDIDEQFTLSITIIASKFSKQNPSKDVFDHKWILRQNLRDFVKAWKREAQNVDLFVSAYRIKPFVLPRQNVIFPSVLDVKKLRQEARAPYEAANEQFEKVIGSRLPPQRTIEESWEALSSLIEALCIHFEILDPEKLKEWKKRDELNRLRMTRDELIQLGWNYYKLLPELTKKIGFLENQNEILYILKKYELFMKTPSKELGRFTEDDSELCKRALTKAYNELYSVLIQYSG